MMKEDILALVGACLDQEFDKGWDAGVQAAFEIIEQEVKRGANLNNIRARFMRELEMKED